MSHTRCCQQMAKLLHAERRWVMTGEHCTRTLGAAANSGSASDPHTSLCYMQARPRPPTAAATASRCPSLLLCASVWPSYCCPPIPHPAHDSAHLPVHSSTHKKLSLPLSVQAPYLWALLEFLHQQPYGTSSTVWQEGVAAPFAGRKRVGRQRLMEVGCTAWAAFSPLP